MIRLDVTQTGTDPVENLEQLQGHILVALRAGALRVAEFGRGLWIELAQRRGVRDTGAYIRGLQAATSIKVAAEVEDGHARAIVTIDITNTAPHAAFVEHGHEAFHLPSKIKWGASSKVKVSKAGVRYIHVPFKHRAYASPEAAQEQGLTAATMARMLPATVYAKAKQLQGRIRMNTGPVRDTAGRLKQVDTYRWEQPKQKHNRRLGAMGPKRPNTLAGYSQSGGGLHRPLVNPAWKTPKYQGLFASGPKGHRGYMTIRTLTENSLGWNIPAVAPKNIARDVGRALGTDNRAAELLAQGFVSAWGA